VPLIKPLGAKGDEGASSDILSPIRNIFTTLPPLLSAVQDQTGITAPSWMMNQPDAAAAGAGVDLQKLKAMIEPASLSSSSSTEPN
jgi:flotillin